MAFSIKAFIERLRFASKGERELWLAAFTIGFGLFVLPFFIYLAGHMTLGAYEHGGLGMFLLDFLKGLVRPHLAYWLVVLGPYLLIGLARGLWQLRKRLRAYLASRPQTSRAAPPSSRPD
jgi:hypothetical protein